jgi:recombination protein RecT
MADNTQMTANSNGQAVQKKGSTPASVFKSKLETTMVQELLKQSLGESSGAFTTSLVELFSNDAMLQKCDQGEIITEALKAAALKLPISKSLGFAWVIARWSSKENRFIPQFQPGYRAFKQLALRTGLYRYINCGPVYEGELKSWDKLTGALDISGAAVSDDVIGYFGYFELLNGFTKSDYWIAEKAEKHAVKYNEQCKKAGKLTGIWKDHFESRAQETVLKLLISKDGIMSVEMQGVAEKIDRLDASEEAQIEIDRHANQGPPIGFSPAEVVDTETGEVKETTAQEQNNKEAAEGPGY